METSTINKILEQLFSNGFWWGITTLFMFGFSFAVYKIVISTPEIKDAIAYWVSSKSYKIDTEKLKKHHIFLQQALMKNKVYSIIFKNEPLKSKVFQVFFATKLEVDIKKIKDFVETDFNKLNREELHIKMTFLIEEIRLAYNKEIKPKLKQLCEKELQQISGNKHTQKDVKECSEKIFNYVMLSPKGYEEFRTYRIENLLSELELLRESPIYDNNNERVYHFLDILNFTINKAILRAGKIFEDFNGGIDKIFNNQIIENKIQKT